ncbi:cobaltochelatase subunit CobN [Limnospira platensis CENA597]|uniref:cobaltochelatase subunit CobN n=1 Tax=Limnospira platensis TaxID=118562 RepID=UPI003DA0F4C1
MHRITAIPGGWSPDTEGVIFVEQTAAPIIVLTAADTEIQTLAAALGELPPDFPNLRVTNLLNLQQQLTIDTYAEEVLSQAKVVVLRLLGGRSYWSYGLEVLAEIAETKGVEMIILPGDDGGDPDLITQSTVPLTVANRVGQYLSEGGVENAMAALQYISDRYLATNYNPPPPVAIPRVGRYPWRAIAHVSKYPQVGILFYRAHYLSGNTAPIDSLCQALAERQLNPVPLFVSSLRDPEIQREAIAYLTPAQLLINTTSFSISSLDNSDDNSDLPSAPLFSLDIPTLQAILSGISEQRWQSSPLGLPPRDVAMNIALPEVDGRIITRPISFKTVKNSDTRLETDIVHYQPKSDRIEFVADLAANWVKLPQTPTDQRRIALILANYPTRNGRLANGVGLDTPASCVEILQALKLAGYTISDFPLTGDDLIRELTRGVTNDPEGRDFHQVNQFLKWEDYLTYFNTLPAAVQGRIKERWGAHFFDNPPEILPIAGVQFGNIFVGIQPSRGYDLDPSLNYHAPDLEPTPEYLAFYEWLRNHFQAHAVVHVGKHGNLEWLPGKGVGLSEECYPEIALGPLPNFYPFIVNDPGEGCQAKRRSQAVILDHLTPPMTRAQLYGPLQQLEGLIDEYYQAQVLDPSRLKTISDRIVELIGKEKLDRDLGISDGEIVEELFSTIDGYLCELKESQIRDGLHILGRCPESRQLRDLIIAIARHPSQNRLGLTRAIAQDWGWELDPLTANPADLWEVEGDQKNREICRTVGDAIALIEDEAAILIDQLISQNSQELPGELTRQELAWIENILLPNLKKCDREIQNLLRGLDGGYIPSGSSGAPTRGRPDVLPTGRNFYAVDIRAIPTETAWRVGQLAAEALVEKYTQDHGEYPQTLGLSVWGTSTMRTGGDDIAQAIALLGVQPVWEGASRRVVDFEILPISVLGRPRVDVTLRISGLFRDAFPNLIDLFDRAVEMVSQLPETPEENPIAATVYQETTAWVKEGLTEDEAKMRSRLRVFGSKPGAYGAGLQGLIEGQNWTDDSDLAQAYLNWSSYAYTGGKGISAPQAFANRLQQMQVVLHNQDNREHDILDSDDYYQFQGGMTVAVRVLRGENPETYFGDNSLPENPKVRQLRSEIARVYRSRVVNPKWIAGAMRHGYRGAFEMAATVDFLFAYDATAQCVDDFMYGGVAEAYILDEQVQNFVREKNPWALRDMGERLLEAHQRGLWSSADQDLLDRLRNVVLEAEAAIEMAE